MLCREYKEYLDLLIYDFDPSYYQSANNTYLQQQESLTVSCHCANESVCVYREKRDMNITLALWLTQQRFDQPNYFQTESAHIIEFRP